MKDKQRQAIVLDELKTINPYRTRVHNMIGISELFADVYKNFCRFNRNAGKWFYYKNGVWQVDLKNCETMKYLKEFVCLLKQYARAEGASSDYHEMIGKLTGFYHREYVERFKSTLLF